MTVSEQVPAAPSESFPQRFRGWVDDTLWGPETGARLLVVHIGLAAIIGLRIVAGNYGEVAEAPPALTDLVPILVWMGEMPPMAGILALQVVGGIAALAAVLRRNVRLAFAMAWVCYLVLAGIRGSRGKVLHNDLLLLWTSAPFLLAPLGESLRDRVPRRFYGWPIRLAVTMTTLIYFFTGFHKLRRTGFEWVFSDNVSNIMRWGPSVGAPAWPALTDFLATTAWAAFLAGALAFSFELFAPTVLVWRRLLPWFGLAAVGMHIGNYLLLGLDYWAWVLTVPLLTVDWPRLAASITGALPDGSEVKSLRRS